MTDLLDQTISDWAHNASTPEKEIKMGRDKDDKPGKDDDRPGKHDPEREGHVHEDTAKSIDPRQYRPPPDDDD